MKSIINFLVDRRTIDGFSSWCRQCYRDRGREYKEEAIMALSHNMICENCGFDEDIHGLTIAHPLNYLIPNGESRGGSNLWCSIKNSPYRYRLLGFRVLCMNCNWDEELERKRSLGYKNKRSLQSSESSKKLRGEILFAYSNGVPCCVKCGDSNINHLCLDEINGGGYQELLKVGDRRKLWRWLRENNYPLEPKRQILCWNHNLIKRFYNGENSSYGN